MNHTARTAREQALKRHRRQLWMWRGLTGTFLTLFILTAARDPRQSPDLAPKIARVQVTTEGYKDADGTWRSFDNGTPITVTSWNP